MDCSAIRNLLVEYREKELDGRHKAAVDSHLKLCEGCRAELREIEELLSAIAQIPAEDPWPGFSRRLQLRLEGRVSRRPGVWLGGLGLIYRWIGGGVLMLLIGAIASWFFLGPDRLLISRPKPEAGVTGGGEVSMALPGEPIRGLWIGSGAGRGEWAGWPDELLTTLAGGQLGLAPEEALTLWNRDLAGVRSLEQLADISSSPDTQLERILDQVKR